MSQPTYTVQIAAASITELSEKLQVALDALTVGTGHPAEPGQADAAPKKDTKKDTKKAPTTADDEPAGLDYETEVRPLVVKLSKAHGRDAALEVLNAFESADGEPCTKGTEVQEADWPALVKKVNATQKRLDKAKAEAEADE